MFQFNGFTIVILGIVFILVFSYLSYKQRLKYLMKRIKSNWGNQRQEFCKEEDIEFISNYFKSTKDDKNFFIDDITWNDLNMNDVFSMINNTQSSVGEEFLYDTLRKPVFNELKLKEKDDIISYFQENDIEREKIQFIIAKLGKNKEANVSDFFNKEYVKSKKIKLIYYRILALIPIISIGMFFINKSWAVVGIVSIVFNSFLYFLNFKVKEYKVNGFNYIASLIDCADKVRKINIKILNKHFKKVDDSIDKIKSIKRGAFMLSSNYSMNELDIITEYFKMFFLLDLIQFEKTNIIISKNNNALKDIYEFVGIIDSCIAIASYRESLTYYTKPVFINSNQSKELDFMDIYHPLISDPVSNSCSIYKSVLITGSNASGKSTFLRTVAINSILAQTIYTCLAEEYKSSFFKTYTSMSIKDSLKSNDSYYIAEIKSLKRIIENIDNKIPCICFIDEILRGTNTVERISASSEVLNYIASKNCICISATHDIELTNILHSTFENYHFQEYIEDDEILFDYTLYEGKSETRNAIKLLSIMGYDSDVIARAEKRAKHFLDSGIWNEI